MIEALGALEGLVRRISRPSRLERAGLRAEPDMVDLVVRQTLGLTLGFAHLANCPDFRGFVFGNLQRVLAYNAGRGRRLDYPPAEPGRRHLAELAGQAFRQAEATAPVDEQRYLEVVQLRLLDDLSLDQIATRQGSTLEQISLAYWRGLSFIRRFFADTSGD